MTTADHRQDSRITLPPVPGIIPATDRPETAPRSPTIRRSPARGGIHGAALREVIKRRVEWIRQAMQEAQE